MAFDKSYGGFLAPENFPAIYDICQRALKDPDSIYFGIEEGKFENMAISDSNVTVMPFLDEYRGVKELCLAVEYNEFPVTPPFSVPVARADSIEAGDSEKFCAVCARLCERELDAYRTSHPDIVHESRPIVFSPDLESEPEARTDDDIADDIIDYAEAYLLPPGGGFNFDWNVYVEPEVDTAVIKASSYYEGMDEVGNYLEAVPFGVTIPLDAPDDFSVEIDPNDECDLEKLAKDYENGFSDIEDIKRFFEDTIYGEMTSDVHGKTISDHMKYLSGLAAEAGFATPNYDAYQAFKQEQQDLLAKANGDDTIQAAFARAYKKGMEEAVAKVGDPYKYSLTKAVVHMLRDKKYTAPQIKLIAERMAPERNWPKCVTYGILKSGQIIADGKKVLAIQNSNTP